MRICIQKSAVGGVVRLGQWWWWFSLKEDYVANYRYQKYTQILWFIATERDQMKGTGGDKFVLAFI